MRFQHTAISLACATLLAACGGGGGGGGSESGTAQSVSFPFPGGETVAIPPTIATITLKATASSGGPITYVSNTPATCSVSGATLSLLKAGECSVNANQAGGNGYAAATQRQLFVIPKRPASVIFRNPGALPLDTQTVKLEAVSTVADRAVAFTTSTPTVCSISGTTLQKLDNGLCTVTATMDGGDIYETAKVVKTMPIGTAQSPEITFLSGYKDTTHTKEDGKVDPHGGSSETGWWCNGWCDATVSADGSSITDTYTYKNQPYTDGRWWRVWSELDVYAPHVSNVSDTANTPDGVRIDAQAALKFNFSQNQEWFATGDNQVEVDLILGHFNRKKDNGNCNVRLRTTFKPSSPAPANYSLKLRDFTVSEACELTDLNPWFELQDYPIVYIRFASPVGNFKVPTPGAPPPNYQTTIKLTGPITFQ
ncbi:hypothetical protein [Pseudoduganella namucuonensis]|uniref:Uncharacterized protein n=1 Tax=Pseudoduganella namucuonensis TaxID=1035707 RepID=A0A1I7M6R9_9BURK|nr:hypothetical protein [Pseudoduganella namucuonensis]SFV17644.1 hypothetical protein SAMN05216552_10693 [Pseudoduganella namucuonensis]